RPGGPWPRRVRVNRLPAADPLGPATRRKAHPCPSYLAAARVGRSSPEVFPAARVGWEPGLVGIALALRSHSRWDAGVSTMLIYGAAGFVGTALGSQLTRHQADRVILVDQRPVP